MKVHPQLLTKVLVEWKNAVLTKNSKEFYNSCNNDLQKHISLYGENLDIFISDEVYRSLITEFNDLNILNTKPIRELISQADIQIEVDPIETVQEGIPKKEIPLKEQKEVWLTAWKVGLEKSNSSERAAKWANDCLGSYNKRFKNN